MSKKHLIIGITGRTGSGKSLACQLIKDIAENIKHIDCDAEGHNALKNPSIKTKLINTFGNNILDNNNHVSRPILRDIVFNDSKKLDQLNKIVHPQICRQVIQTIKNTSNKTVIIEGALIHQVGLENFCDHTVCIDSPTTAILKRVPEKKKILDKQLNAKDYINMCHHTVKNNTSIDQFEKKIESLLTRINVA